MIRDRVTLIADGGDMTVGRRVATYVYGDFNVILPDGQVQQKADSRIKNGYVYRPDNRPTGRFDFGFVRADATINLEAQTSDLEQVVDTAQRRVSGDIFFERDISTDGFGGFRPGIDFHVGDIVNVMIWGKRLQLPVTAIDFVTSPSTGLADWRVHVGGQMISDPEGLKMKNDQITQQIAQERRERLKAISTVEHRVSSAATAAESAGESAGQAQQSANTAQKSAEKAQETADETARNLAMANKQRIAENEAFTTALSTYYEATRPQTGTLSANGTLTWRSASLQMQTRTVTLTALNTSDVGFLGVQAIVQTRVDAIRPYSDFVELKVSKAKLEQSYSTIFTEGFISLSVVIYPNFNFAEILASERRKKGLV